MRSSVDGITRVRGPRSGIQVHAVLDASIGSLAR
jgi:hypothetical protein